MKAVSVAQDIHSANARGTSVIDIIKGQGPEVLEIVKKAGAELFPNLPADQQTHAGVTRLDPQLVSKIQNRLNDLGADLDVDGDYGKNTKAAVTAFQRKNGLTADGWAGPLTQAKLFG
jgi:peptidoglycan hydrolase-like protein with peptidoglycan-binding domain